MAGTGWKLGGGGSCWATSIMWCVRLGDNVGTGWHMPWELATKRWRSWRDGAAAAVLARQAVRRRWAAG